MKVPLTDLAIGTGGLSELHFREARQEPVMIMTTSDSKPGLNCKTCNLFILMDELEHTETECAVCRTTMPAGVRSCPNCGWTYEVSAE